MEDIFIQAGDILFVASNGRLGRMIKFFTRKKGESKTVSTHVGQIVGSAPVWDSIVVEAQLRTTIHTLGFEYLNKDVELCIFRPTNLSVSEIEVIRQNAMAMIGRKYGFLKLVTQAMDWCLNGKYVFRRLTPLEDYPDCSFLVAKNFHAIGKDFGVKVAQASPDDIWDFVVSNPDKYRFVWQRGNMYLPGVTAPPFVPSFAGA